MMRQQFSEKYSSDHAEQYFRKHQAGFWRRLSNWRETAIARKSLKIAGDPASVLDLPSGTGRFWSMLAEKPLPRHQTCSMKSGRWLLSVLGSVSW